MKRLFEVQKGIIVVAEHCMATALHFLHGQPDGCVGLLTACKLSTHWHTLATPHHVTLMVDHRKNLFVPAGAHLYFANGCCQQMHSSHLPQLQTARRFAVPGRWCGAYHIHQRLGYVPVENRVVIRLLPAPSALQHMQACSL